MRARFAGLALLSLLVSATSPATATKLRVKGGAVIEARLIAQQDGFELRGTVTDDAGRALGPTHVRLRLLAQAQGPAIPLSQPVVCAPTPEVRRASGAQSGPDGYLIGTNGAGAFCVRLHAHAPGTLELAVESTRNYDGAETRLEIDDSKRSLLLQFVPEPRSLALAQPSHTLTVDTRVQPSSPELGEPIELTLLIAGRSPGEQARVLTTARTTPGELASFVVSSQELGPPGPAVLTARYPGSPTLAPSQRQVVIERTALVSLVAPQNLPRVDPGDGFELEVEVKSATGHAPPGAVEALIGDETVGTAPVVQGRARLVAEFEAGSATRIPVRLRYLPGAPWWVAERDLHLTLEVAPPSPWRRLFWAFTALALAWWVIRGWRRPARVERHAPPSETLPSGRASVDVVEAGAERSGWRGRVVDAHEGGAVARARVTILIPAFAGTGVATGSTTDDDGHFQLTHVDGAPSEGAVLEVAAPWHATLRRPVPPAGQLVIQLVSRRRALLDALVAWARRRGRPWSDAVEPTPAQVIALARDRSDTATEQWARAVEHAAFGPEPPDEQRDQEIRSREPS